MKTNIYETLEFDKLLTQLKSLTISPLGTQLIDQLIPFTDVAIIKNKLSEVTELRAILDFDDPFPIFGLKDIREALNKTSIQGYYLFPEELKEINATLYVFRKLSNYINTRTENYPLLNKIISNIKAFYNIEKEINRCIDKNTNEINDNASPALAKTRRSITTTHQKMRKMMENMVSSLTKKKYLQESVISIRNDRLVLMVKDTYRKQVKGIIHDQSATGATLFIEPMQALELNNHIRELELEEKREVEKILLHLTSIITERIDDIITSLNSAAKLDFIYAKARLSNKIEGHQPQLNDQNYIEIINGKHPLLILKQNNTDKVIPLNFKIGDEFNTLVITGPNAGGKTVAIKTIGLLSIMIACGLHVPVDPCSNLAIFLNFFSAIGDQQSLENDLSTFSSHIEKLKNITDNATNNDLIIIDEICSGTDPDEGASLSIAIMEKLSAIGCITIVTTHLGALKAFAHETEKIINGSMEFNSETLEPSYRFRLGLPGSSYAFEIAERWGLSKEIIERSRKLVGTEKHLLENLLIELDQNLTKSHSRLNEQSIKQSELDGLIKLYRNKRDELVQNKKDLKQDAIREAEEILSSANIAVEQTIKEIKEEQASREAIKQGKKRLNTQKAIITKHKIKDIKKITATPVFKVSIGQQVKWIKYNKVGIILSKMDSSKKVMFDTGDVKIKVPVSELITINKKDFVKPSVKIKYDIKPTISTSEIDLRGMRAEEAIENTEKFIEEALLASLETISIIHGKGTGVLRVAINELLTNHTHVKNKKLADWNQGGTGVTVVELM